MRLKTPQQRLNQPPLKRLKDSHPANVLFVLRCGCQDLSERLVHQAVALGLYYGEQSSMQVWSHN